MQERGRTYRVGWPALHLSLAQQSRFHLPDTTTAVYADLVASQDQFSALDLLRLTAVLLLVTPTSGAIVAEPWDILSTGFRSSPRTVSR
jgi:hypothetical protein